MSEGESKTAEAMDDESVEQEMKEVEENPPEKLEDWPGGKAKYKTFGGPEAESGYGDGATDKLGPADLEHHEDGSVSIEGEKVDNPEDYKGEPIPGGPTDPDAPPDPGFQEQEEDEEGGDETRAESGEDDKKDEKD
jgi:hypothetical protein